MSDFGAVITNARRFWGLSQKEIATRVGLSPQYLNDLERGRRNPPPDDVICRLAEAIKVSPNTLFFVAGRIPPALRDDRRVIGAFHALTDQPHPPAPGGEA